MSGEAGFTVRGDDFELSVLSGVRRSIAPGPGQSYGSAASEYFQRKEAELRRQYPGALEAAREAVNGFRASGHLALLPIGTQETTCADADWLEQVEGRRSLEGEPGRTVRVRVPSPNHPERTHRFELELVLSALPARGTLAVLAAELAEALWPEGKEPPLPVNPPSAR